MVRSENPRSLFARLIPISPRRKLSHSRDLKPCPEIGGGSEPWILGLVKKVQSSSPPLRIIIKPFEGAGRGDL